MIYYNSSPLHPNENIPSPAHRTSKKSSDPFYLKNDQNQTKHVNEDLQKKKSSDLKHKSSHSKKHKKDKSNKTKKLKDIDIDLLTEDPNLTSEPIIQNGSQHFEELVTPMEENPKSAMSFVTDLLEELDPVKSNQKIETETELAIAVDSSMDVNVSPEAFADLLAGGGLKFKKKTEIPNDVDVKKVFY